MSESRNPDTFEAERTRYVREHYHAPDMMALLREIGATTVPTEWRAVEWRRKVRTLIAKIDGGE